MQPYFLPYIGYFQLIASVDQFIIYDNIKYTKKGWFNRNRILLNGRDVLFSLPLKSDSDFRNVIERELADNFNREKLLNQLEGAYNKAPYFQDAFPIIKSIVLNPGNNLFDYIYSSIIHLCKCLHINTEIKISSQIPINHSLKGSSKVIEICKFLGGSTYINPIGGLNLYEKSHFKSNQLQLLFIKPNDFQYNQFEHPFVPWLSIVDLLMFNSIDLLSDRIHHGYDLI